MAWVGDPKTWAFQEGVESSELNAEMRDRFLAMGPHLITRKTSDQVVTSSTTLVDATNMAIPALANEVWQFEFTVLYSAGTTGDFKFAFTFPSGRVDAVAVFLESTGSTTDPNVINATVSPSASRALHGATTSVRYFVPIRGIFANSGTAGNLQLQFAQNASDANSTTMYANSATWGVKLA